MNAAIQRIFSALALLVIFGIALYLRLYGIDWAYKDGAPFSPHPDERHYESCANIMRPGWLTPEEDHLPIRQNWKSFTSATLVSTVTFLLRIRPAEPGITSGQLQLWNLSALPVHALPQLPDEQQ